MTTPQMDPAPVPKARGYSARQIVSFVFVLLAVGGMAVMEFSETKGLWYWLIMVPVFGGLSMYMEWDTHRDDPDRSVHVREQLMHWLGALLGVLLAFLMHQQGLVDRSTTGLIALLVLGVSTLQAGLVTTWRVAVLGVLLLATLATAITIERFFWVSLILVVVALAVLRFRRRPA